MAVSRPGALWAGWLLAPAAWLAHLSLSYALAPLACRHGSLVVLHLLTAAMLAAALAGAWLARRNRRRGDDGRSEFLGAAGMWLSLLFAAVIAVQGLPPALPGACA
jgi:hypothetical protein